ncbi:MULTISPECIES: halocarboxylic acid dehydrogenase DehI family protein [Halococcus]|uniref:Halocarboxylic acid dehydrogenase DehI n=1 Tax=Halococcus salifodinae DSM 8989 TaxID=1227456 RepID=M0MX68_9EURY|nr:MULTISPECIES: halocarboxylic acid dehydrogenase DehI family protein [Halococcus]EMA49918.1 hypothetical protein C450_16635 [Halococcus salifodinae DSM 8989]
MDTSKQCYEIEATGRQRGVYDDIKRTFRAPIVNWIFRTTMANAPRFLEYAWGQLKPLFDTRAFARYSVAYRDTVLSELEEAIGIPTYRRSVVDVSPAEYDTLRGQLATFDVVAPRLVFLFETMDRALHDGAVGTDPAATRAATAPFPAWLDTDRGRSPTMIAPGAVPDGLDETVSSIQSFHGLGDDLPSIYRCLAQWPSVLDAAWNDLEPFFESDGFDRARENTAELTTTLVESTPYTPRLAPEDLRGAGFDDETIEDVRTLFREFNTGAVETVLPTLPIYAATVDAEGVRDPL